LGNLFAPFGIKKEKALKTTFSFFLEKFPFKGFPENPLVHPEFLLGEALEG